MPKKSKSASRNNETCSSDIEASIKQISSCYVNLQKEYLEWARQFKSYKEVTDWLLRKNVKRKVKEQKTFNLFSSDWNSITLPVLSKEEKASEHITQMEKVFGKFSQREDRDWYLLYFIHPVLHELYYFDVHYPEGYSFRLAKHIRRHRLGIKGAKTYLNREDRTANAPYIKSCCTSMFKLIHLDLTTSTWDKSNLQNIEENIRCLEIGENQLSSAELDIAITLSKRARMSFDKWIKYAPCAINEGPIFTLKDNKSHSECFREIVEILQSENPKQNVLRRKLKKYYEIVEYEK